MEKPGSNLRVLFVDDEEPIREVMRIELPCMGHEVTVCADGTEALKAIEQRTYDAAIVDLRMPGLSGWDVVNQIKSVSPETEVIIHTGHGNLDEAVRAIRHGAYDFLQKPCRLFDIANVLQRVAEKRTLTHKTIALEGRLKAVEGSSELVGDAPPMQQVKKLIEMVAPTDSTVLVWGDTGTGKELVARRIHELSPRSGMPFVPVNCGALAETLVESEFFGHRKGAFTGADSPRKGLLEVAHGGTLFLDELGELDKGMQVKLLRFLESGEVRRVGENDSFQVDVRVVCATNRDLQRMVQDGTFREDLFFRVNTFEIRLPPLRQRSEDLPILAAHLTARHSRKRKSQDELLSPEAIDVMQAYDWPGNVRELANALEHAVILSGGQMIRPDHLPASIAPRETSPSPTTIPSATMGQPKTLREIEMEVILRVLDKHDGDKPKTAAELGIALKTLYNKLNQYHSRRAAG